MADTADVEEIVDRLLALGVPVEAVEPVREWVRTQRVVTPSRTDRQPPTSATQAKGGQGPAAPDA